MIAAERQRLADAAVTIDGKPAKISGTRLPFATVRAAGGVSVEFAWSTAKLIVDERGGRFKS